MGAPAGDAGITDSPPDPDSAHGRASSDSADASLLISFSQVVRETQQTDSQGPAIESTAADLAVLDHMSQQLLDETAKLGQMLDDKEALLTREGELLLPQLSTSASPFICKMERLARAQVVVQQSHFKASHTFLDIGQRPVDELDDVQWAVSSQRINLATFVVLVFLSHVTMTESVYPPSQLRARQLCIQALDQATRGFFAYVVPDSRRDVDMVTLLVDMLTQQWLIAANDERHLQDMAAEERGATDADIQKLLAVDPAAAAGDGDSFDAVGVGLYRSEMSRRLNRISGSKLPAARSHYAPMAVWSKVARLCGECAAAMALPTIITSMMASRTMATADDDEENEGEDGVADGVVVGANLDEDGDGDHDSIESAGGGSASEVSIDGDVEVTIFKNSHQVRRAALEAAAARASPTPGSPMAGQQPEPSIDFASSGDVAPIDPSFLDERRLAVIMRDVQDDPHLDELMGGIDAEPIDIGEARDTQAGMPRRMRGRRGVESDSEYHEPDSESGGESVNVSGSESDGEAAVKKKRPRRSYSSGAAQNIVDALSAPSRRRLVRGNPQGGPCQQLSSGDRAGEFRGRRGIAAEDLEQLRIDDGGERVAFTPSPQPRSPRPESPRSAAPPRLEEDGAERRALGQYQPRRADDDDYDDEPVPSQAQASGRGTATGGRRGRSNVKWTAREEACLVNALIEHGPQWTLILKLHGEGGSVDHALCRRTRVNLKDKARTIKLRLLREGRDLGPFADATGSL